MSIFYKYEWDEPNRELTVFINPTEAFYEFAVEYASSSNQHVSKRKNLVESARKFAQRVLPKDTVVDSYRIKFQQFLVAVIDEKQGAARELVEGPAHASYKVKGDETLKDIAQMLTVDEASLKRANNLEGDTLFVGMDLYIPCYRHTVVTSDSILKIAQRYDISKDAIRKLNSLSTDCLKIGQELKIPKRLY